MKWIAAIQQAVSYIEEHLLEEINYEDAARQVHISSYEFHRAFSFLTGMTANAYIRSRRLSLAGREIVETDSRITDIALKYGYDTPESFTKAFTRFHGVAPRSAREESAKLVLFNPIAIKLTVEGGKSMDYRIVQTKEQSFIAVVRSFSNDIINDDDNHDISDFWGECQEKNLIGPIYSFRPEGKRDLYGLCSPTKEGEQTFDYGIGVLLDEETAHFDAEEMKKAGYTIWNVKPCTYVVFECIGCIGEDGDCISETWSKFYKEFLPQMGYEAESETDYEIYFEKGKPGVFCELWIPVRKA
ncbi:MAG: AraC family transcriptional regulator [Ruminococcaceae bacterium]|nr:AraC family transcriptional regulator [Oscillospiraceae bacterium]